MATTSYPPGNTYGISRSASPRTVRANFLRPPITAYAARAVDRSPQAGRWYWLATARPLVALAGWVQAAIAPYMIRHSARPVWSHRLGQHQSNKGEADNRGDQTGDSTARPLKRSADRDRGLAGIAG